MKSLKRLVNLELIEGVSITGAFLSAIYGLNFGYVEFLQFALILMIVFCISMGYNDILKSDEY